MTVEHRKEEENLLTRSYKRFVQAVKKPPSRATWLTLIVLALLAVLVGSWFWFTSSAGAANSELWLKQYETPTTTADLERFADDPNQQGAVQGRFARAEAARQLMQSVSLLGAGNVAPQIDQARAGLEKARDAYEKLVRESGDTPALMQESLLGAARANETLGDLGKAKDFYARLAKDYPNTAPGREADARARDLDDEKAKKDMEKLKIPSK